MSKNWTASQLEAINAPRGDILVSAAAGSGKTSILVERIIKSVIESEQDITRILALTFTNAAAAEMRERVLAALSAQLENHPENIHLQKQITMIGQSNICTIHSFCQRLLQENFHRLGISPCFTIVDEVDAGILKNQALEEVLADRYLSEDKAFLAFSNCYGGKRDDTELCNIVLSLHNFSRATVNPEEWLSMCFSDVSTEKFGGYLLAHLSSEFFELSDMCRNMLETAELETGFEGYCPPLEAEYEQLIALGKLCELRDWDTAFASIHAMKFDRVTRKKGSNGKLAEYIKNIRNGIKDAVKKYRTEVFYGNRDAVDKDLATLADIVKTLCSLVIDFDKRFAELKNAKDLLDFSDLEHCTIKLLDMSEKAAPKGTSTSTIAEGFDEVFIDEFQDINLAQAAILNKVTRNNSFVVGDVKQSIYRFRNAEPKLFLTRKASSNVNSITLSGNFRSAEHVIDAINYIFEKIMCREIGDVEYTDSEKLECARINLPSNHGEQSPAQGQEFVELHVIEKKQQETAAFTDEELQVDSVTREAQLTAMRIVQMIEVERPLVYDKTIGEYRKAEYRDVTILSSSTKRISPVFASALSEKGIPVFCQDSGSFFAALEVSTMLSFLQIIDNPYQDIPLLTVMRSACYRFTDEELVTIRTGKPDCRFYSAVLTSGLTKCHDFLTSLDKFREYSKMHSIAELIRYILSETHYEAYVSTMSNASLRLANLNLLFERADKFERNAYKSLFEFVQYIKVMLDSSFDYPIANYISKNENAVRIMTIHKSKGLEFPIVFLVNSGKQFNMDDLKKQILFDFDLGIGAGIVDYTRHIKYPTIARQAIAVKKRAELLSEEMRLLYVALTRSADRLVIIGSTSDIEKSTARWSNCGDSKYMLTQQRSFLDWICIAASGAGIVKTTYHRAHEIIRQFRELNPLSTLAECAESINEDMKQQIIERLTYVYPHEDSALTKVSVSDLVASTPTARTPKFLEKSGEISPRMHGIILHFVMQNIDIHDTDSVSAISMQIERLIQRKMLSHDFAKYVSPERLYDFFCSDIGARMKKSENVQREVRFFATMEAGEVLANEVLLQGVVDCYFEEDDGIVLLDYKTGNAASPEYDMQMSLYSKALGKILKKNIKNTYILTI